MSLDDVDRPLPAAMPATDAIHRRWVLSRRAEDGRPLLVREDRIVHPDDFAARAQAAAAMQAAKAGGGAHALH